MSPDRTGMILFRQFAVLGGGFMMGLFLAYCLTLVPFDFSGDLAEARRLGIVSRTVLEGYAKAQDTFRYLAIAGGPILGALAAWLVWSRGKTSLLSQAGAIPCLHEPPVAAARWLLFATLLVGYLFSYSRTYFQLPNFELEFLYEEGAMLAWAQSILAGGVFSRELTCQYGPLLIYSLAGFMKIFGVSVLVQREFNLVLNLLAYTLVVVLLFRLLRTKAVFVGASIGYLVIFSPFLFFAPNCTYLRVALGFLPLLLWYRSQDGRQSVGLLLTGAAVGLSLLLSQEVGMCALLATLGVTVAQAVMTGGQSRLWQKVVTIAGGVVVVILPFLAYLQLHDALGVFLAEMLLYPRLYALGYGSLPFPALGGFIAHPFSGGALLHYWVIGIYAAVAVYFIPTVVRRQLAPRDFLTLGLLLFGLLLYRAALGRSDEYHVFYVSQPAFLLCFDLLDRGISRSVRSQPPAMRVSGVLQSAAVLLCLGIALTQVPALRGNLSRTLAFGLDFRSKLSIAQSGAQVPDIPRAGVAFEPRTAVNLGRLKGFLDENCQPGEPVYFFPNEPAYYFLFERPNPTRYPFAYHAATVAQRQELIAGLERVKPRFVVYSRNSWRVDDISEDVWVPEVVAYLRQHYRPALDLGDLQALRRVE
ncbi:MAG TPA: hypothetical protein VIU41_04550 [Geobacteraceae bacterium]